MNKTKNENWSGGRLKEISAEISRVFDGQPVVDAKNDLRIVILDDDIKKGKPKNFEECVFAQACRRVFASKKVLLMKQIAYISLPDEEGNYKVERYIISNGGRKVIADFDQGKLPSPGTSFVFHAPTNRKGATLEYMREAQAKFWKNKKEAKLIGKIKGEKKGTAKKAKHIKTPKESSVLDIRNGTGLIQMKRSSV